MNRYFLKAAILLALAGCKGNQEQEVLEPRWLAAARPEAYL